MTNNSTIIFNGFLNLTGEEKKEVLQQIENYYKKETPEKRQINEEFQERTKRIMGPLSSAVCPACGK